MSRWGAAGLVTALWLAAHACGGQTEAHDARDAGSSSGGSADHRDASVSMSGGTSSGSGGTSLGSDGGPLGGSGGSPGTRDGSADAEAAATECRGAEVDRTSTSCEPLECDGPCPLFDGISDECVYVRPSYSSGVTHVWVEERLCVDVDAGVIIESITNSLQTTVEYWYDLETRRQIAYRHLGGTCQGETRPACNTVCCAECTCCTLEDLLTGNANPHRGPDPDGGACQNCPTVNTRYCREGPCTEEFEQAQNCDTPGDPSCPQFQELRDCQCRECGCCG